MNMKRIAILYGGRSGEHEVSLVSAASILRHLDASRFEPLLIGVDKKGEWHLQDDAALAAALASEGPLTIAEGNRVFVVPGRGLAAEVSGAGKGGLQAEALGAAKGGLQAEALGAAKGGLRELPVDLVFPVLHGTFGEDGTIQGLLESAGLPYVGAGVLGSALGMDKEKAKELWLRASLPVVPFLAVRANALGDLEALGRKILSRFGWPVFVKPACAGSSVGASKVASFEGLKAALEAAFEWDDKVLVEPFVVAREIECAVLGNEEPQAFEPGEVAPIHEFYDYEAKYLDPDGARLEVPARITQEQAETVKRVAVAAFKACELSGMARVDFFIDKRTGDVMLNEVNTIPGFTSISMYPRMCESGGTPYAKLITRLAEFAIERFEARAKLKYMK
jgi:D-alanine-D-alanine ligase